MVQRTVGRLCFCGGARLLDKLFGEGLVVEEVPGVVEFVVEGALHVGHAREHAVEFLVAHQAQQGRVDALAVLVIRSIVVAVDAPERLSRLAGLCAGWLALPSDMLRDE